MRSDGVVYKTMAKYLLLFLIVIFFKSYKAQNISISTDGATPRAGTLLDVKADVSGDDSSFVITNRGYVGIGISNPNSKFHLENGTFTLDVGRADVYFENNANDNPDGGGVTLRTSSNPSNTGGSIFAVRSSGQAARLWIGQSFTSTGNNDFYVGSSNSVTANDVSLYSAKIARSGDSYINGGNVGIGTTIANDLLHIRPISFANDQDGGIRLSDTGNNWNARIGIKSNGSGLPRLFLESTVGSEAISIIPDGNVGIGNSAPDRTLDVTGIIRASGEIISTSGNSFRDVSGNYGVIHRNDGTNYYILLTNSGEQYEGWNGFRPFRVNVPTGDVALGNGALFIDHSTGKVGIGNASPNNPLDVTGTAHVDSLNINGAYGLPTTDGTANYVLATNGSGHLNFVDANSVITDNNTTYTAGDGLILTGTDFDLVAGNGLTVDAGEDKVELGGSLDEATTITLGANALNFDMNSTGDVSFVDGATTRMIIQNDGKIGIGTTPVSGSVLDVEGAAYIGASSTNAVRIEDGIIRMQDNIDAGRSLEYRGTKLSIGAINGVTASATATGLLNVGGFGDGQELVRLRTNNNTGYISMSQATVSSFNMSFVQAGATQLYLKNDGNIGIGNASPGNKLDVTGTAHIDSLNINGAYGFPTTDGVANYVLATDGSGNISFVDANSVITDNNTTYTAGNALTLTGTNFDVTAGNGLTVDAGEDKVELGGSLDEATTITLGANALNFDMNSTGDVSFMDGATTRMIIEDGGNVGIGVSSSSNKLHVNGTTFTESLKVDINGTTSMYVFPNDGAGNYHRYFNTEGGTSPTRTAAGVAYDEYIQSIGVGSTAGNYRIRYGGYGTAGTAISWNEAFSIKYDNGFVGIGNNNPAYRLDVLGTAHVDELNVNGNYSLPTGAPGTPATMFIRGDGTWAVPVDNNTTYTAGDALTLTGTDFDVAAGNGLTVDAGEDKVELGGSLDEATTISLGANALSFNMNGTGDVSFMDGGSTRMIIEDGGNVGIGVASPQESLDILGAAHLTPQASPPSTANEGDLYADTDNNIYYYNGTSWDDLTAIGNGILVDADNDTKIQVEETADDDIIRFDVKGTEHFTMEQNLNGAARLEVLGNNGSIFIGESAGAVDDNDTDPNTFIGHHAGLSNTVGDYNTAVGYNALDANTSGVQNVAIGHNALSSNTVGDANTAVGYLSLLAVGGGSRNTAVGQASLNINTGSDNVAIGSLASGSQTGANGNTVIGSGAAYHNQTGANNVILGAGAGAGVSAHSKSNNTLIGTSAGYNLFNSSNANVMLGYNAGYNETGSNKLYIENSNANAANALIYGEFDNNILRFNGNVGIGTNGSGAQLTVYQSSMAGGAEAAIRLTTAGSDLSWDIANFRNDRSLRFDYEGTDMVTFLNNGNVGIGVTAPNSTLEVSGSISVKRTAVAANYTILATDYYIGVTNTGSPRTITLPAANSAKSGKTYIIKDESGGAGSNNITIDGNASETIDGSTTQTIASNYGVIKIICDGSNWFTIY